MNYQIILCLLSVSTTNGQLDSWFRQSPDNVPQGASNVSSHVYGTPMYGGINDYAYYFVDVLVGTPGRRQSVILDSGSSLLGFPCTTCGRKCGRHIDEPFDVARSSTSELYTCMSPRCVSSSETCLAQGGGTGGACRYSQVYSEGSSIEGYFFSDEISLAPLSASAGRNPRVRYDYIGCHQKETVLFTSQQASGILGVSFPRGGKQPTVMDVLSAKKVFSICAAEDGGLLLINGSNNALNRSSYSRIGSTSGANPPPSLQPVSSKHLLSPTPNSMTNSTVDEDDVNDSSAGAFGIISGLGSLAGFGNNAAGGVGSRWLRGWNRSAVKLSDQSSEIIWTKIVQSTGYGIKVVGLSVRDPVTNEYEKLVDRGFGEVLVDSGTTYTYLPNDVYMRLSKYLIERCQQNNSLPDSQRAGICLRSKQDLICYDLSSAVGIKNIMSRIPSLSVELGDGAVIEWQPQAYLFRKTDNVWCTAIENNRRAQTILGMSFLKQKQVIFDRENSRIGFVAADCPSYTNRLEIDTSEPLDQIPQLPKVSNQPIIDRAKDVIRNQLSPPPIAVVNKPSIADYVILWSLATAASVGLVGLVTVRLRRINAREAYFTI